MVHGKSDGHEQGSLRDIPEIFNGHAVRREKDFRKSKEGKESRNFSNVIFIGSTPVLSKEDCQVSRFFCCPFLSGKTVHQQCQQVHLGFHVVLAHETGSRYQKHRDPSLLFHLLAHRSHIITNDAGGAAGNHHHVPHPGKAGYVHEALAENLLPAENGFLIGNTGHKKAVPVREHQGRLPEISPAPDHPVPFKGQMGAGPGRMHDHRSPGITGYGIIGGPQVAEHGGFPLRLSQHGFLLL